MQSGLLGRKCWYSTRVQRKSCISVPTFACRFIFSVELTDSKLRLINAVMRKTWYFEVNHTHPTKVK